MQYFPVLGLSPEPGKGRWRAGNEAGASPPTRSGCGPDGRLAACLGARESGPTPAHSRQTGLAPWRCFLSLREIRPHQPLLNPGVTFQAIINSGKSWKPTHSTTCRQNHGWLQGWVWVRGPDTEKVNEESISRAMNHGLHSCASLPATLALDPVPWLLPQFS